MLTTINDLHISVTITYASLSLITFIIYAIDKSRAKNNLWRISEKTLHFFALIGGWPGAAIAQKLLRHKSKKRRFKMVFWCTVFVNLVMFLVLATPLGEQMFMLL